MDKTALENRIAELRKQLAQLEANGNATLGALRECERWLKVLDDASTTTPNGDK